jgi:hypothetical protein
MVGLNDYSGFIAACPRYDAYDFFFRSRRHRRTAKNKPGALEREAGVLPPVWL